MESIDQAEVPFPIEAVRSVFREYPVRLALLFGSHARGTASGRSDVDLAVEFDGLQSGDCGYNDALFGLGADLDDVLSFDVDVVDIHSVEPAVARRIFEDGVLLYGQSEHVSDLRAEVLAADDPERSPRERFDDALDRIDEHMA